MTLGDDAASKQSPSYEVPLNPKNYDDVTAPSSIIGANALFCEVRYTLTEYQQRWDDDSNSFKEHPNSWQEIDNTAPENIQRMYVQSPHSSSKFLSGEGW